MQILIADDDLLFREVLRELLSSFGHDCVAVDSGGAALTHLVAHGADVVLSDWQMPGLTGPELCERVRMDHRIAPPYFILLTGRDEGRDIATALQSGVDDYLAKPPDIDELERRLLVAERVRAQAGR